MKIISYLCLLPYGLKHLDELRLVKNLVPWCLLDVSVAARKNEVYATRVSQIMECEQEISTPWNLESTLKKLEMNWTTNLHWCMTVKYGANSSHDTVTAENYVVSDVVSSLCDPHCFSIRENARSHGKMKP